MTQTVPEYSGCPWPIDPACLAEDWETLPADVKERAVALASSTLSRLTGYQVGGCPITVRPCKAGCAGKSPSYYAYGANGWMNPHIGLSGTWINSCGCDYDCSCTVICEVELPAPVGQVLEISLNGTIIADTDYRVDGNRVVWTGDDECPWPTCQDMTANCGEDGSFCITYLNSYPVDSLGAYAAGILANEFAKACTGGKCRLPANVTSISRQGVTFELAVGSFPGGYTGIREVDAFIALWNPQGLRQQTRVWSPDVHSPRVMR
jgi:hypothetical protein